MSKRQWMVLLMLFMTYLLLGAFMFYHIESRLEAEKILKAREERIEINALLHLHYIDNRNDQHEILEKLTNYCGKSVYNYTEGEPDEIKWDFYNSFYFAYTVVSTIGYGNLAPTNMLGRMLMIFYGVVGIPMNGILLSQLGEFFGRVFVKAHEKYKSYKRGQHTHDYPTKKKPTLESRKAGLAAQICMYLTPGIMMFIFFPAIVFSHFEDWTYDESVYYAFVTLTTIGFGDYVAGKGKYDTKGSEIVVILYKTFLICWISFGLGYIVMIMTFIARGMRSKKITRIEHKLAMNLKHTQSKIWNEFNKEMNYLRRVFNELQLSKVKRVYVDEYDYEAPPTKLTRSSSFPDLRELCYGGKEIPAPHPRRRANSEVVPMESQIARVVSETDLQRIDKTATFATHAMVQPAELLAQLVNILGYIPPPPDDFNEDQEDEQGQQQAQHPPEPETMQGVQGFSDKEILSSEQKTWNPWKIGGSSDRAPSKPRSRALSEIRLNTSAKSDFNFNSQNEEWTWSDPTASKKIQELMKERESKDRSIFPSLTLPKSVSKTLLPKWMKQFSGGNRKTGERSKSMMHVGDFGRDRHLEANFTDLGDDSRTYFTHTGVNMPHGSGEGSNLLEETSVADFLRALTALHSTVGSIPDDFAKKPQRKLGTASLTPPKLPSLFTLFSPISGQNSASQSQQNTVTSGRRFSLKTTETSGASTPKNFRRSSLAHVKAPRRFSLRPVVTPSSTPPRHLSPYLSNLTRKKFEAPSSGYSSNAFLVDRPTESLVEKESAVGFSTPVSVPNVRRFSLRPAQDSFPGKPGAAKVLPRWKAGMLQRQISQMNLQKRVRAFSLSDVASEPGDKSSSPGSLSPLAKGVDSGSNSRVTISRALKDFSSRPLRTSTSTSGVQKSVTIVSPVPEIQTKAVEVQQKAGSSFLTTPGPGVEKNSFRVQAEDGKEEGKKAEGGQGFRKFSITTWEDSPPRVGKLPGGGSTQSEGGSCSNSSSTDSSRKSSTSTSKPDKPRVSIDSYKPLVQVTIDKPVVNPFEQYRATVSQQWGKEGGLEEVKVETPKVGDEEERKNEKG